MLMSGFEWSIKSVLAFVVSNGNHVLDVSSVSK